MSRLLRRQALSIFRAALAAADPVDAVLRHLRSRDFSRYRHIYVVGAGKAGASMAKAAERALGRRITAGLVNVKHGTTAKLRRIELNPSGHPIPDEAGVAGSTRIAEIAAQAGEGDLVLCLISGGASALLPLPAEPITLAEKQATTQLLLACGANIHEFNCVRKHLSRIKGGQLARLAAPAAVEALLLSDVIGDDLDVIGSGPTAPDASTFAGAFAILEKFELVERVPATVRERLRARHVRRASGNAEGRRSALPRRAQRAGGKQSTGPGCCREVREVARFSHACAFERNSRRDTGDRAHACGDRARDCLDVAAGASAGCIVTGGETTVTLRGDGLGGRNQEFVLAAALEIAGLHDVVVLSAGTDGSDGPTDAAGAIADGDTLRRNPEARRYLDRNDSYHYFQSLRDLVITDPPIPT